MIQDGCVVIPKIDAEGIPEKIVEELAKDFISWRKGPFKIFDILIDTEWISHKKWDRLAAELPDLEGKVVLDVGCNNGYYMFRMAQRNPKCVIGIDPVLLYKVQFEFINQFIQLPNLHHWMIGAEEICHFNSTFDVVFHMGVLYHHRDPIQQLLNIREAMTNQGTLILETICLAGDEVKSITPKRKFAGMGNIWLLPTVAQLRIWLERLKFKQIKLISQDWEHEQEQRKTEWSGVKSYSDHLCSIDNSKTIEGYDRPVRVIFSCQK